MAQRSLKGDVKVEFTEAASRQGIDSGESVKTLFGKIRKWLSDLKAVAFSGSYNDLDNKPTIPPAVAVKGNAEAEYRTGNVNLTAANIGLGNVNNTSDADKPISTATQAALNSQQERINYNTNNGVKNLLKITGVSATNNGVTFTVDKASGTITANGTATAETVYNITVPSNVYGNVCLSGCANGGSSATYDVFPKDETARARPTQWDGTTTAKSIYSEDQWTEVKYVQGHNNIIQIRIRSGVTVSNLQFKPMLTSAELAGLPFQPYAKSNAELTRYTDYVEISQDEDNHTDIISIGATKQLDIVHNDYYLENEIILKGPNVYLPGSAEIVTAGKRAEISLATGAAEVKLVANTDSSNTPYLYLQSGVIPYISIQPNSNKMQFITDANGTQKIAIDTNGVHIASGGTVFEVKSDGVYINGTKIGG